MHRMEKMDTEVNSQEKKLESWKEIFLWGRVSVASTPTRLSSRVSSTEHPEFIGRHSGADGSLSGPKIANRSTAWDRVDCQFQFTYIPT